MLFHGCLKTNFGSLKMRLYTQLSKNYDSRKENDDFIGQTIWDNAECHVGHTEEYHS